MRIRIEYERPPMRAVYSGEREAKSSDFTMAAAIAAAELQFDLKRRIKVIGVSKIAEAGDD